MNNMKSLMYACSIGSLVSLAACQNPNGVAKVQYEQVGACNGYVDGNTVVSAGAAGAFVLFRILTLDNRNGNLTLNYNPERVCLTSSSQCVSTSLHLAQKIGVLGTSTVTVPPGKLIQHNGFAVIRVPTSISPHPSAEASQVNYVLHYNGSSSEPGVHLDKKNHNQTPYVSISDCLGRAW